MIGDPDTERRMQRLALSSVISRGGGPPTIILRPRRTVDFMGHARPCLYSDISQFVVPSRAENAGYRLLPLTMLLLLKLMLRWCQAHQRHPRPTWLVTLPATTFQWSGRANISDYNLFTLQHLLASVHLHHDYISWNRSYFTMNTTRWKSACTESFVDLPMNMDWSTVVSYAMGRALTSDSDLQGENAHG